MNGKTVLNLKSPAAMNIETFREYCLSLPGVVERMPFLSLADPHSRNVQVFYVGSKWFCFVDIEEFAYCSVKSDRVEELRSLYAGARPAWHMNKRHWISLEFGSDLSDARIRELVAHSHALVFASLTRREREEIETGAILR